jgi:ribosomal protein S18 acetylase RimI-like enzyme
MVALRPFEPRDDASLISWLRTPDELRWFAGWSLSWPLDTQQLDHLRASADTAAWTAYLPPDEAPVGHAELRDLGDGRARVARVIVDPARRGTGLGHRLVVALLERGRNDGFSEFELVVYATNTAAQRAYAAAGFRDVGTFAGDAELRMMRR